VSTVLVSLVVLLNCFVYLIMSCFSKQIIKMVMMMMMMMMKVKLIFRGAWNSLMAWP